MQKKTPNAFFGGGGGGGGGAGVLFFLPAPPPNPPPPFLHLFCEFPSVSQDDPITTYTHSLQAVYRQFTGNLQAIYR